MDLLTSSLLLILTYALIRAVHSISSRPKTSGKLPPGPKPLPIIGNLHQLGDKPHKSLFKLAKIHGPIMSLKLGQVTTIVVSSAATAKEVLQTHDQHLSNRTIPDALRAHGHNHVGLPWIPVSDLWRSMRKICNTQLFAAKALDANQDLRRGKVSELLDRASRAALRGKAMDLGGEAFTTALNLLSNTVFSVDLADPRSELAREFKDVSWNIMKEAGTPNLSDYFPALKPVDPQGVRRRMAVHLGRVLELFGGMVERRLRERSAHDDRNNDVLDTLLDNVDGPTKEIDSNQMMHLLLVLFVAGTDTTASTFQWAMAELLRNPEVLAKARAELIQVIGRENQVEESDISRLPYLQAVVKETLRLHPVVPLLLPRKAEADVAISGGFTIPKGSQVLVNAWAIGRDASVWADEPEAFRPERFVGSPETDFRGRSFELIAFGGGRRICPGLPLALRMLHLMLGTLVHSFEWRLEDGVEPRHVDMEDKFGITLEMANPLRAIPIVPA